MMRVKVSSAFYTETLGVDVLAERKFQDFTLFFLAHDHSGGTMTDEEKQNSRSASERLRRVLELTHNHGTESDENFQGYASSSTEPGRGFGHIAITIDDIEKACERFEKLNVPFKKRLTDGKMKNIAFFLDPDGYWIEVTPGILRV